MNLPILTAVIVSPVLVALLILGVRYDRHRLIRQLAVVGMALPVLLVAALADSFRYGQAQLQFVEHAAWIPSFGISYFLGVDGLSLALVALTAVIGVVAAVASFGIEHRVKEYFVLLLLLQTAVFGVFLAQDYVLFYVFWELVLIPMYFLIGIWGGPRREYAAIKFLIYTMTASLVMLVGILALYFGTGAHTFSIPDLARAAGNLPPSWQYWIFLAFFLGFAVKVPVVPFHTWLPDAHVEAPTPISVILAAVLLKMGTYGFFRITHPTFPAVAQQLAYGLAALGVINIVYGGLAALAQKDLKKLVAYSSVNHMGFVLIGLAAATPVAVNAAVFQMISHGLISALLFLMVGVFYDRTHTREIARLSGLFAALPVAGIILAFAAFANLGLPGLSGFIAEFFTLLGSWNVFTNLVVIAALGLAITAAFNIFMMQRVLMGSTPHEYEYLPAVSLRELVTLVPLMALVVLLGLLPTVLTRVTNAPMLELAQRLGGF